MKSRRRFGLRAELIASYLVIGLVIAVSSLMTTRTVQLRLLNAQLAQEETERAAFELTATVNAAFEEGFGYVVSRDDEERSSFFRRLANARTDQAKLAARADLRPGESEEIGRVGAGIASTEAAVRAMFDEVERTGKVSPAAFTAYEASMDVLAASAANGSRLISARIIADAADARAFGDRALIAVAIGAIALALVVGHLFSRRIVGPVRRLRDAARAFGRDRTMNEVDVAAPREIVELAEAFRSMATDVRSGLAAIAEHRLRLDDVFSSIDEMLVVVDCDGVVTAANRATSAKVGVSEADLVGRRFEEIFSTIDFEEVWLRTTSGGSFEQRAVSFGDAAMRGAGALRIPVSLSAALMLSDDCVRGVVCVAQDLSEQKRIEAELRQAQKLEAIGILSAGIAHEINNPMQYINDSITFVGEATESLLALVARYRDAAASPGRDFAEVRAFESAIDFPFLASGLPDAVANATEGVQRVTNIVRLMKAVSHPSGGDMSAVDVEASIRSALAIARSTYKYVAVVETDFAELPPIDGHAGELTQVLLNILVNAAHAVEDKVKGTSEIGKLVVRTRAVGDDVVISVSDTGNGVPEKARARIFDSFFTTKEVGRGTGQGLAIARKIIESHGGSISFESTEGQGTTFHVRLPKSGASRSSRRPNANECQRRGLAGCSTVP